MYRVYKYECLRYQLLVKEYIIYNLFFEWYLHLWRTFLQSGSYIFDRISFPHWLNKKMRLEKKEKKKGKIRYFRTKTKKKKKKGKKVKFRQGCLNLENDRKENIKRQISITRTISTQITPAW